MVDSGSVLLSALNPNQVHIGWSNLVTVVGYSKTKGDFSSVTTSRNTSMVAKLQTLKITKEGVILIYHLQRYGWVACAAEICYRALCCFVIFQDCHHYHHDQHAQNQF
jgi:hypothetical protein